MGWPYACKPLRLGPDHGAEIVSGEGTLLLQEVNLTPFLEAIRLHIRQERALGSPRFQAMVAKTLNRPVEIRPRGRPRKVVDGLDEPGVLAVDSNR